MTRLHRESQKISFNDDEDEQKEQIEILTQEVSKVRDGQARCCRC